MANPEALKMLKKGVRLWNIWRSKKKHDFVDLGSVNLRGRNLQKIDLHRVHLSRAILSEADLSGAILSGSDLTGANLEHAILNKSNLIGAKLQFARLYRANLRKACLCQARLCGANLRKADLRGAILSGMWGVQEREKGYRVPMEFWGMFEAMSKSADLRGVDFSSAILDKVDLRTTNLQGNKRVGLDDLDKDSYTKPANFAGASLKQIDLRGEDLHGLNFEKAILTEANLSNADLSRANFRAANLRKAVLNQCTLVETNLTDAILTGSSIYGISAWNTIVDGAEQYDLSITPPHEPQMVVDNLEVAQFVYLLLDNKKIRDVLDTIGKKGVLILGRFTKQRKSLLNAIRTKLRKLGYLPMMFDFEKPTQRNFTETIKTLVGISRFVIVDITNPKSSPLELQATIPDYMVPFVPIIKKGEKPLTMFRDLQQQYGKWVLDVREYDTTANLVDRLDRAVVRPALKKADELLEEKARSPRAKAIDEY